MLYTIGYEGLNTERFVEELKCQGVRVLVDVREMPLSRKRGFSKTSLAAMVEANGIEYRHIRELGAPREVRYRLRETGDWDEYCRGYQAHLEVCEQALADVVELLEHQSICLMCFEADHRECHRSLITQRLTEMGDVTEVSHINPRRGSSSAPSAVA